jgi:hypothetical protein
MALMDVNQGGFKAGNDANMRCYLDAYNLGGETMHSANVPGVGTFVYHAFTQQTENPTYLSPLDGYTQYFMSLKPNPSKQIIMGGIISNPDYAMAAAPPNGPGPEDTRIKFVYEEQPPLSSGGDPYVIYSYSCATSFGTGTPNLRLTSLLGTFPDPMSQAPTLVSICDDNYGPALQQFATRIQTAVSTLCIDIAAEAAGKDPNTVCVMDELGPQGDTRRSNIPASAGWTITPQAMACIGDAHGPYEITISPMLRSSFATDSQLAVTCASQ